ncbi:MAG: sulfatase-like hydrolase/transferase [Verrucomicrobiota bacterium]
MFSSRSFVSLFFALVVSAAAETDKPNFVFVIADDLGWADVGFHGGNAPTPHLDNLAAEGLELTHHYVAPVCSPTRAGFLTGRCWSRFGVTTPTNSLGLPFETMTLPKALKTQGYETCLTGKWHLGSKPEWGPGHFGFDHSYGSLAGGVTAWTHRYKVGEYSVTWHRNHELLEEDGHVTDLLTNEAVEWINERSGEKPFFLYVPYTAVHLPVNEPTEWLERVPESITSDIGRHYAACIMHLDDGVGKIRAALEKKGFAENTVFVFTSDNGGSWATNNTQPYPKDDSPSGKVTASNDPLRNQKGSIYEGGIRVPTLVSWPAKAKTGKLSTPVCVIDWMPTFCQLAGFEQEEDLNWDGVDLSTMLTGGATIADRPIYIAAARWRSVALFQDGWKLVVHEEKEPELYHIMEDPSEKTDLASKEADRVVEMKAALEAARKNDKDSVAKP